MRKRDAEKYEVTYESSMAMADYILKRPRSKRTMADYRRAQRFLDEQGMTPQQYRDVCAYVDKQPISKSRYRMLKSAYQLELAERVSSAVRSAKTLHEQGEHDAASASQAEALEIGRQLAKQKPDYAHRRFRDGRGPAHPEPKTDHTPEKHGKRQYLGKLNKAEPEWRVKIYNEMPETHAIPMALLNMTGCRPDELERPIRLEDRNGLLAVTINGAKVTKYSGQKERTMVFDPEQDQWAKGLLASVQSTRQGRGKVVTWPGLKVTQRALHKSHARAVIRALGAKWEGHASLYSYRHAMSADLKAAGHSRVEIAMALGHASDRSQVFYGLANQASGGGGRGLKEVTATREVKTRETVAERMSVKEQVIADPDAELFADLDGTKEEAEQDRGIDLDLW
jgi:integrase